MIYPSLDIAGRSQEDLKTRDRMEWGSQMLLEALWKRHPAIMRERTGKMFGP